MDKKKALVALLIVKAFVMLTAVLYAGINLGPEEAQYWTWSQKLNWGYYSKPPGIAWEIWLGTLFAGNTELGVRLGALVLGFLIPLAVYRAAKQADLSDTSAFWAGVILALSPVGVISSFITTTDAGMVLFWTLAFGELVQSPSPNYRKMGVWVLCSALFKWTGLIIWLIAFAGAFFSPRLRKKSLIYGVLISLFALLPSLIWNMQHDFATFKHVSGQIFFGPKGTNPPKPNFFDFLGAQAALISPIFFGLYLFATVHLIKHRKNTSFTIRLIGIATGLLLLAYCFQALFKKMQGNWCVFIFPTMSILIAWYAVEKIKQGRKWMIAGATLSIACVSFLLGIPSMQRGKILNAPPLRKYPLKECIGWDKMADYLSPYKGSYFFSDTYQMASLLSFYAPEQKRAYFFNIEGRRRNQFSYWPSMSEEQTERDGIFVWSGYSPVAPNQENRLIEKLAPYFKNVELIGQYPIYSIEKKPQKEILIIRCNSYNGKVPDESDEY